MRGCHPDRDSIRADSVYQAPRSIPRVRLVFDPPVRVPDQPAPLPGCMPRGERLGPDLIDVVTPRRLAPDDLPGTLDGDGVVDPIAAVADPEPGLHPDDGAEAGRR